MNTTILTRFTVKQFSPSLSPSLLSEERSSRTIRIRPVVLGDVHRRVAGEYKRLDTCLVLETSKQFPWRSYMTSVFFFVYIMHVS